MYVGELLRSVLEKVAKREMTINPGCLLCFQALKVLA